MAKLFLVFLSTALIGVLAEPPSSYLPPQARNSVSSRYGAPQPGAPSARFNGAGQNGRGGAARTTYYNSQHENQFGGRTNGRSNGRSRQNGFSQNGFSQSGFGQQFRQSAPAPAPAPVSSYSAPRSSYNAPAAPSSQYGAPSAQYGAPQARTPSSQYGAPLGKSLMDDDLAEPANYEYNYEVQALDESGPEFGHQESREEDSARGSYHVLLPDGRMQIVEYEADEEGFRPVIRYEETGAYADARNGQDNQGGYY